MDFFRGGGGLNCAQMPQDTEVSINKTTLSELCYTVHNTLFLICGFFSFLKYNKVDTCIKHNTIKSPEL